MVKQPRYLLLTRPRKLAGLALRQCIDLGYHRSLKRLRSTPNPLRLELRKRVFWCAYVMECQAAVMLGRPLGIPPQEVDAEVFRPQTYVPFSGSTRAAY